MVVGVEHDWMVCVVVDDVEWSAVGGVDVQYEHGWVDWILELVVVDGRFVQRVLVCVDPCGCQVLGGRFYGLGDACGEVWWVVVVWCVVGVRCAHEQFVGDALLCCCDDVFVDCAQVDVAQCEFVFVVFEHQCLCVQWVVHVGCWFFVVWIVY